MEGDAVLLNKGTQRKHTSREKKGHKNKALRDSTCEGADEEEAFNTLTEKL